MADLSWFRALGRNRPPAQTNITTTPDPDHPSSNHAEITNAPPIPTSTPELLSPPTPPLRTPDSSPTKHRFRSFESLRRASSNILNSAGTSSSNDKLRHNHSHSYSPFAFASNKNNLTQQRASSSLWTPAPIGALPLGELDPDEDKDGGLRRVLVGRRGEAGNWHNPNLMQMVETLRAVMIRKHDALESIPIVYNSYVMSLIEGFAHINQRLESCQAELDELKRARSMELEQFRAISEEWMDREGAYKAEIKRLELVLAKESIDGVASVALARHESLVDRSGTKRFKARLERMSGSHERDRNTGETAADLNAPTGSSTPTRQYSVIAELPRHTDHARDVWMSRAVERQDPNVQRFLPQSSLHKHRLEASMNARDERLSPDGTRSRRGPRHPADDQSPEMQEWAITSGKRRLKTTSTVSIEQIQKHADDQQRLGGEFLPPLNSYAWDDAESSTSGSSVTTAEEDLLAHSGMDGADDNMLKVQKCLTPINSGPERDAAQQGMTTEDATGGFYEATSQGSSSPSKQQRQQNRLTAIKCPIANAEVPWESGEGCAEARPNAGISTGIHDMSEINVVAKWTPGAGSEVDIGHQGKPPPHEQASRPRWYRRASSASTRKRSLRRYSFDKGDDEVLPVTSSAKACDTTFDQPREDVSCPPQVHVQEGTFQAGRRTTVAPSTSTGSVVWIGKEEAVTDKVSKQGTSVGYGLPKITVSGVGGESGDCSGDNDGGARRSVLLVGGPFSSLSPSSSSPNLQSAADSSHRGGNAARIAAERAVARQSGGGVGRK